MVVEAGTKTHFGLLASFYMKLLGRHQSDVEEQRSVLRTSDAVAVDIAVMVVVDELWQKESPSCPAVDEPP